MRHPRIGSGIGLALAAALALVVPASAQIEPSAEVLVPYFTVDLANPIGGDGTLFAVCNHGSQAAEVVFTVYTNWGIRVLETRKAMVGNETVTVNLRDWLVAGTLLDRQLGETELAQLQAALTGALTPQDHLYYGTRVADDLAVGYVIIRTDGPGRPRSLWGDFFTMKPGEDVFQADTLVNIDWSTKWNLPCSRLGIRFLEGDALDTHLVIWSPKHGLPSANPVAPDWLRLRITAEVYDEPGNQVEDRVLSLLPAQVIRLDSLTPPLLPAFGWLELALETDGFVGADFNQTMGVSGGLHAYCLPKELGAPGPLVRLEKLVNGQDADVPPGPIVPAGSTLVWTFEVTNTGSEPLYDVVVSDDTGLIVSCPASTLAVGAAMTCTATSMAQGCQRSNLGTVSASSDVGPVTASNTANYYGQYLPALSFGAITVNGLDARVAPGPGFAQGTGLAWNYELTNTGDATLTNVHVLAAEPVTCPKSVLDPGEGMTCTSLGTALAGDQTIPLSAEGTAPCGDAPVTALATVHYVGIVPTAGIAIVKRTNGIHVELGPGPKLIVGSVVQWTYVVTNVGEAPLADVNVVDSQGAAVACPKSALAPAESMTCTASGTAELGQYTNIGTATGTPPAGPAVSASDTSWYYGVSPSIALEKLVNGHEADSPPWPEFVVGSALLWTYVVVNTGTYELTSILVVDDQGVAVTCPKTVLAPGESMTCTGSSKAVAGETTNLATVGASWNADGGAVSAQDPATYVGRTPPGDQGCTPGYWKNHYGSWPATGYSTSQAVDSVFPAVNTYYPGLGNATLLQALGFGGGPGAEGAAEILLRAGVAALLNAAHPGVAYPRSVADVLAQVDAALLQNRDAMLALAAALDADNNRGCPLN
jgi:hypothetical protein